MDRSHPYRPSSGTTPPPDGIPRAWAPGVLDGAPAPREAGGAAVRQHPWYPGWDAAIGAQAAVGAGGSQAAGDLQPLGDPHAPPLGHGPPAPPPPFEENPGVPATALSPTQVASIIVAGGANTAFGSHPAVGANAAVGAQAAVGAGGAVYYISAQNVIGSWNWTRDGGVTADLTTERCPTCGASFTCMYNVWGRAPQAFHVGGQRRSKSIINQHKKSTPNFYPI